MQEKRKQIECHIKIPKANTDKFKLQKIKIRWPGQDMVLLMYVFSSEKWQCIPYYILYNRRWIWREVTCELTSVYVYKNQCTAFTVYICIFSVPDIRRFQRVDVVFCQLNMSDVWVQRIEGDIWGQGWGPKELVGKGTVDSQHRTGVEGSSHPCTQGYHAK
jgi:hypothetical protein